MSTNLERFKAIVERGFSQGDLTVADEVCADRLIEHEYLAKTDVPELVERMQPGDVHRVGAGPLAAATFAGGVGASGVVATDDAVLHQDDLPLAGVKPRRRRRLTSHMYYISYKLRRLDQADRPTPSG